MKIRRMQAFPILAVLTLTTGCSIVQQAPVPPAAKRIDHKQDWHGETVVDPYFWLREKTNPEVPKYLESENAYTEAMTKDVKPFQEALYKEMLGRIKQTDLSVPTRQGKYYYYTRTEEGKQYPIYCRKRAAGDGSYDAKAGEVILLDQNEMAKGLPFLSIGEWSVSDNDNLLVYSTDTTGFRQYILHVKDLHTGQVLPDSAERVTSAEWAADNKKIFFVTEDKVTKRSNQLWRLALGGKPDMIYEEKDQLFRIGVGRSKDKKYLVLGIESTDTWEMRYLDSATPSGEFKVVLPREKGHKYVMEHRDGLFYIRTNKGAKNFRVVTFPVSNPATSNWKEFLPHNPGVLLQNLELFKGYAVAHEKSQALNRYRVFSFKTQAWHDDGMLMKKKNTFTDFIDCAEYLVARKWTSRDRLVIEGGSAGGLLMGAVTNMRPDLFRAVHFAVPFVDIMNTMMDASLPLTVGEYLEWGNPNEKPAYDYMKSYSPYDNLAKKAYPAILVTTSFNDSQVMYWEPAKYVAKLRTLKTGNSELLLKCKMEPAGHGGASGRYDKLKDTAALMNPITKSPGN